MRWVDTYFPFTNPSFELEIYFKVCYTFRLFKYRVYIIPVTNHDADKSYAFKSTLVFATPVW